MDPGRLIRGAVLGLALCGAMLWPAGTPAATFLEFLDPNPATGNQFGATVVALSTGNVVITSPFDDAGGTDAGAVYLFNGSTGALISTLRGSTTRDWVGSGGVTVLANGNYVVLSPDWDNGAIANAGAATWGSGTTGVSGTVSAANSLVGSTAGDLTGFGVTALPNGNYVVRSPSWDNGAAANAGAATWGSGTTGVSGAISVANGLVGSTANDQVGVGVTVLSNGNYVVSSSWTNGPNANAGAATWGSGTSGVSGTVSFANSLVGSKANDQVGIALLAAGVKALTNGNYVVTSPNWDNGPTVDVGAATWGDGTSGIRGPVTSGNSLVGSRIGDNVGIGGAIALSNGNYVVLSPDWSDAAVGRVGAATWRNGATGVGGTISAANSLVGSTAFDRVGGGTPGAIALANGNYVVSSPHWDNGASDKAGAATWGNGTSGVSGTISAANSLVGSTAGDQVGVRVTALSNGNYVVLSMVWDNGAVVDAGAATWGNGTSGESGAVSAANSLVGSTAGDQVSNGNAANFGGVTALPNGNYVVLSPDWHNGANGTGAATWGSGTGGVVGTVSAANSLVGSKLSDLYGATVAALTNGNYVVVSPEWDDGTIFNVGAATWGSGTTGVSGAVYRANSLVGSAAGDRVGNDSVTVLPNGNYVVGSSLWRNGANSNAGAATWGSGTSGVSGTVSAANSLMGSTNGDRVGVRVTALSNGNYVVRTPNWALGSPGTGGAGAATWGDGTSGVRGTISVANSLIGTVPSTNLQAITDNGANGTFIAPFIAEGGGRVRVGPQVYPPVIVSADDIPDDQGGWLRLTFVRSALDAADGVPPLATYAVWRHVPGTLPAAAASAFPPGTWELVTSVPAMQQAQYVVAVPTISNAAPNDFVVSAHATTPSLWFMSDVVSGQSVDNLAPAQPTLLTASYSDGQTHLQWAANTENDLGFYRVYRGTSAGFTPGAGNLIATVTSTRHADAGPAGRYYKVSAVDVNDNESSHALITPEETTDGDPVAFALEDVRPNPASGAGLHVAFALPTGAPARLELLDVSGRRVLDRDVGSLGAGRHTVNLAESRRVAPGLYWVRLTQGADRSTTRVAVID